MQDKNLSKYISFFNFLNSKRDLYTPIELIKKEIKYGLLNTNEKIKLKPDENFLLNGMWDEDLSVSFTSLPKIITSGFGNVNLFKISGLTSISNITSKRISIMSCNNITEITHLKCKILQIDYLISLTSIDYIEADEIRIANCPNLKKIGNNIKINKIIFDQTKFKELLPNYLKNKIEI